MSDARQMMAEALERFGRLDILVNNAGIEKNASFCDMAEADYNTVLNVNLKGVFFATQAIAQHFLETKRPGKIIILSCVQT